MVKKYYKQAMKVVFFSIFALLAFLILPPTIGAQGNLRLGPLLIHPGFQVSEEYSDNLYHAPDDQEESDYITTLSPFLRLQLPLRKHLVELGYKASFLEAASQDNYSTTDQYADFLIHFKFPGGLEIRLADDFKDTSTAAESETDKRNHYIMNDSTAELAYGFAERWKIKLDYTYTFKDFDDGADALDNFEEQAGRGTIFFKVLPKTSILLEYRYSNIDNEDLDQSTTDNLNYTVHGGLSWEPGAKVKGAIKAGYTRKVWEASNLEDEETVSIDTDVTWHATQKVSLGLKAFRNIVETLESLEKAGGAGFGMTYITMGGNLSFLHKPTSKITWGVEFLFARDEYNSTAQTAEDREDDRLGGSLSFKYRIQEWLGFGLRYSYTGNNSNVDTQDYKENRGMVYLNLAL